jgi:hypothetical protein
MKAPLDRRSTLEGVRTVSTVLLREPVKEAVREALREEAAAVEFERTAEYDGSDGQSSGGRSKLSIVALLVVLAGVVLVARRRMGSESGEHDAEDFESPSHGSSDTVGTSKSVTE